MGGWRIRAALCVWASLSAPLPAADEALARDGRPLSGSLSLAPDGRLQFTPTTGDPRPASTLDRVRLSSALPPPFRIAGGWRFLLVGGQQLTGDLLGLDAETLRLRTAWAPRLELPRAAVISVTMLPG